MMINYSKLDIGDLKILIKKPVSYLLIMGKYHFFESQLEKEGEEVSAVRRQTARDESEMFVARRQTSQDGL